MTACGDSCSANGALVRRGRRLEYLTVGWNVAEAAIAMSAGILAGSTALIGFGLDSLIESLSGSIMLWRALRPATIWIASPAESRLAKSD